MSCPESRADRLESLGASDSEEERDFLQSSLFSLTTHLAQVQFRLRQVVNAPLEHKKELLNSLEEFAFRDITLYDELCEDNLIGYVKDERRQQKELIKKLKTQIGELKCFDHEEYDVKDLKRQLRFKENLEEQLRTQIADLERFIEYLRNNARKMRVKNYFVEILKCASSIFQIFTQIHFNFRKIKRNVRSRHWGDLRAKLELAIISLKKLICNGDTKNVTVAVRKELATSIRDLMEHGTKPRNLTLVPIIDCFSQPSMHSWDIILEYYNLKSGQEFNSSTAQMLSKSFNLQLTNKSTKKNLLSVIEQIISTHSRYKRSNDSHFRAFVCAALNAHRLVSWLNLIFHCGQIVSNFYHPWSYVANTGYRDGLRSLDLLTKCKFDLPVDLDVLRFQSEDLFA